MRLKFTAFVRKEESKDYWLDIPDLPGCISYGKTIEEAKTNFKDALDMHLEDMREEGQQLSRPRSRVIPGP